MDRKKIFAAGFLIVIAAVAIVILYSVLFDNSERESTKDINVYFLNPVTKELNAEKRTIDNGSDTEAVEEALNILITGPKNTSLVGVMPENLKILKCKLIEGSNNTAEVDFSNEYSQLKESQELYCRAAIVWTLTELDFIDTVHIFVDGKPLTRANGELVGDLDKSNVIVNPVISPDKVEEKEVTLYFSDEQAMGLCPEKRTIEVKQSQTLETPILEQLIIGPKKDRLYPTVPSETKIRNIKTEDGICYVDLSNDFVKSSGGSTAEMLTIYSIVNSLTELDNVKKVQFLIEGEKVSVFRGHVDFSKTFEREDSLILQEYD